MTEPLHVYSIGAAGDISADDWDRLSNPPSQSYDPFISHGFFTSLEESGSATSETGWRPMHLIAEDDNQQIVGIMPLYLKGHSQGEYVFDHGWARGFEMAGGQYYPKLLSAVPFTPVTGRRLFALAADEKTVRPALIKAAIELGVKWQLSSLHINFVAEELIDCLKEEQLLIRHDTQFHWENQGFTEFEQFLESLQSRKRKAIRKERRVALEAGLEVEWVSGDQIKDHHFDAFYKFYIDTFDRKWGRPYLTRAFFDMIGDKQAKDIALIFAKREDQYIAGALNFIGTDTLYGRYWGASEHHDFLHFEICYYQAIDYALAHGLNRVEAGAQGEHKLLRGYSPVKTNSAHYILHDGLRVAVEDFIADEGRYIDLQTDLLKAHLPYKKED